MLVNSSRAKAAFAVGGIALVLGAAGCSSNRSAKAETHHRPAAGTGADLVVTATPRPPHGKRVEPERVTYALVSADGRTITVEWGGGGCTRSGRLYATSDAETVELHLVGYTTLPDSVCTADALAGPMSTTLPASLGSRALVDALSHKRVPFFDGNRLATIGWLPAGASKPVDGLIGRVWDRTFMFSDPTEAPIDVAQFPGNALNGAGLQASSASVRSTLTIHGHPAILLRELDGGSTLSRAAVAFFADHYTYVIRSSMDSEAQVVFPPSVLEHIADDLTPP
jgi:hypothetical protein